ncbi:MAG TPA: ferritin-like domain-containing protein [Alphaproteobacteria bacterium]|nr:ferritin-like domain-containing protein [Alphaproteobacteria bacterium]
MATTEKPSPETVDTSFLASFGDWGQRAALDPKKGLILENIKLGTAAERPPRSEIINALLPGSTPRKQAPRLKYWVSDRDDIMAYNVANLYEEAVQRQWSSATDIPWHTVKPLPDELERAACVLFTFLTIVEFVAGDIPGSWVEKISPEYYEVKAFLVTQVMDEARHLDVFRKRALMNGGGLMETGRGGQPAAVNAVVGANIRDKDFVELTSSLHLVGEGSILSVFRMGEWLAQNEAEKRIFRLCAQDEARHVAFGVMHIKHVLETQPERRDQINHYLDVAQAGLVSPASQLTAAPPLAEAQAILLGGGVKHIDRGYRRLMEVRRRQLEEFFHRCDVVGLPERRHMITEEMRRFLEHPIVD